MPERKSPSSSRGRTAIAPKLLRFEPITHHRILSRHVEQKFDIRVALPPITNDEAELFPAIYITDANLMFDACLGLGRAMMIEPSIIPRVVLVGVGYPSDSPVAGALLRARDFTFPGYPQLRLRQSVYDGVLAPSAGCPDFYGAEAYQAFLAEELVPLIERTYPVLPGARSYFGHSGGGGFGLFTLATRADLFNRYIISSPGLRFTGRGAGNRVYHDHDLLFERLRLLGQGPALTRPTTLFLSAGELEDAEPALAPWQLTKEVKALARQLADEPIAGLDLKTAIFPRTGHATAWAQAFIQGLQAVFRTGAWGA